MKKHHVQRLFALILLWLWCIPLFSQETIIQKYWVYFGDKANNEHSVSSPETFLSDRAIERRNRCAIPVTEADLPVTSSYVQALELIGVDVLHTSKWFNAATIVFDRDDRYLLEEIAALEFVSDTLLLEQQIIVGRLAADPEPAPFSTFSEDYYGPAYHQIQMIGGPTLHGEGLDGEGIHIAVFDSGFQGVDEISALAHLFDEGRILSTENITDQSEDIYNSGEHGTSVLSTMAAFDPDFFVGTAPGASYHLFVTEFIHTETHIEEVNWLIAAERADERGADIITSSLNYIDFDLITYSYGYEDLDGETTIVTRAAEMAASKGILVVSSGGNTDEDWNRIAAPADGPNVLAVGQVNADGQFTGSSGMGPTYDGRVKPDVVAQGVLANVLDANGNVALVNGTSYSAPQVAGMAACMWQCNREAICAEMILARIRESGSQFNSPDEFYGFGIPDFTAAHNALAACEPLGIESAPALELKIVSINSKELLVALPNGHSQIESAEVYAADGRRLLNLDIQQSEHYLSIDRSRLQSGSSFYLLKLTTENQSGVLRFGLTE